MPCEVITGHIGHARKYPPMCLKYPRIHVLCDIWLVSSAGSLMKDHRLIYWTEPLYMSFISFLIKPHMQVACTRSDWVPPFTTVFSVCACARLCVCVCNLAMCVSREAIGTLRERTSDKATVKTKRVRRWDVDSRARTDTNTHTNTNTHTSLINTMQMKCVLCGVQSKGLPAVLGQINLQFSGRRILLAVSTDSVTVMIATSLQVTTIQHADHISTASHLNHFWLC